MSGLVQSIREAGGILIATLKGGKSYNLLTGPVYEWREQSGNITTTGVITQHTFSNLEIDSYYRVTTHWMMNSFGSGEQAIIETQHDGDVLITDRLVMPTLSSGSMLITTGSTRLFRATGTTLEFNVTTITGSIEIVGGNDAQTYVQLERVNGYREASL